MSTREITLQDGEQVASMCPLPGRPYVYVAVTTHGRLWEIHMGEAYWRANRLPSKTEFNAQHNSGML